MSRYARFTKIAVAASALLLFGLTACQAGNNAPDRGQPTTETAPDTSSERIHPDQLSIISLEDEDLQALSRLVTEQPRMFEDLRTLGPQVSVLSYTQETLFKQFIATPEAPGGIDYEWHRLLIDLAYTQIVTEFNFELDPALVDILWRSIVYVRPDSEVYSAFFVVNDGLEAGFGNDIVGTTEQDPVWPEN